jgi:hypothetical protein
MSLDLLLDMTLAYLTEGMDHAQRVELDRVLAGSAVNDEVAQRRAFALAHGEM